MYSILVLPILPTSHAASAFGGHVLHEERTGRIPSRWARLARRPPPDTKFALGIALAQHDVESAEQDLLRVSDPSSPQFAQYWDQAQVTARFAPRHDAFDAVESWLREAGVDQQLIVPSEDQGWLFFNTTIAQAESLLVTEFSAYNNTQTGERHLACDRYSLPRLIRQHVDFAMPTIHLGLEPLAGKRHRIYTPLPSDAGLPPRSTDVVQPRAPAPFSLEACSTYTTPDCLRALYNITSGDAIHPNSTLGVFEVSWNSWLPQDLDKFFGLFSPAQVGSRPTMERINGGYSRNDTALPSINMEADLDFQYAMALTHPQPVINYQVGEMWQAGTLNGLLSAMDPSYCPAWNSSIDGTYPSPHEGGYPHPVDCGTVNPASVISISYAWNEAAYPPAYLRRQCLEFLKLGLQGVTVVVSSGDCGPAGVGCACIDPTTGGVTAGPESGLFNPVAPASCPYVLTVGGTQLRANATVHDREVPFRVESPSSSHISSSGGGFSNLFAAPAYQRKAVRRYLDNPSQKDRLESLAAQKGAKLAGRGYPDVSANAANYVVAVAGQLMTVQGTSAAAPVVAAILSKLNNARLRAGKKPVGFVNPVLYAHPHLMNDVVWGVNHGCGEEAFEAGVGWDPVTGLGTLDYKRLLELYLSLP